MLGLVGALPQTPLGETFFWRKKVFPQTPFQNSLTLTCQKAVYYHATPMNQEDL